MFHIKIEDLNTGKVCADVTTDCIIAAINQPIIGATQSIACITAPEFVIKYAIASAKKAIRVVKRELREKKKGRDPK